MSLNLRDCKSATIDSKGRTILIPKKGGARYALSEKWSGLTCVDYKKLKEDILLPITEMRVEGGTILCELDKGFTPQMIYVLEKYAAKEVAKPKKKSHDMEDFMEDYMEDFSFFSIIFVFFHVLQALIVIAQPLALYYFDDIIPFIVAGEVLMVFFKVLAFGTLLFSGDLWEPSLASGIFSIVLSVILFVMAVTLTALCIYLSQSNLILLTVNVYLEAFTAGISAIVFFEKR